MQKITTVTGYIEGLPIGKRRSSSLESILASGLDETIMGGP